MKTVLFGNPQTDSWTLSFDGVSAREDLVAIQGELETGFFVADTPMCVAPQVLEKFAAELRELDRTLRGTAQLESKNQQSEILWRLTANHLGHIISSGRYAINRNALEFQFVTDQTQLAPLLKWVEGLLERYEKK
ncbi:MAG: hypothetical protein JWQ62_1284 [Lacunisphaera sp.]|nr:hypothetical protein [Lacunisphaera sp.]